MAVAKEVERANWCEVRERLAEGYGDPTTPPVASLASRGPGLSREPARCLSKPEKALPCHAARAGWWRKVMGGDAQTFSPEMVSFQSRSSTMTFWNSLIFAPAIAFVPARCHPVFRLEFFNLGQIDSDSPPPPNVKGQFHGGSK